MTKMSKQHKPVPVKADPLPVTEMSASAAAPLVSPAPTPQKIYEPIGVGLRTSYQCLIGCRHCYQKAEPGKDVSFDEERLMEVLQEAHDVGFTNLGLSGGEPFLFADMIYRSIKTARDIGYEGSVNIVTNAFWGKTQKSAETVIKKLADAGYNPPNGVINISVGEFHQEWISNATVANVVEAHWAQFKQPLKFFVTFSKGNGDVFQKLRDYITSRDIPRDAYTFKIFSSIAHMGRANDVLAGDTNPEVPIEKFGKCLGLNKFSVEPNGKVAPCCGFNRFINGLFMGSLYEHTVGEIVDRTNRSIVFQYIKYLGLDEIHAVLSEKFEMKPGYRHNCEACQALFNKEEHVAYLEEVAPRVLGDRMQPNSLAEGTKYFHGELPQPKLFSVKSDPIAVSPADMVKRIGELEAENTRLREALEGRTVALKSAE